MAIISVMFAYGVGVGHKGWYPYQLIISAIKTGRVLITQADERGKFKTLIDISPETVPENRIEFLAGKQLEDPVLWHGGLFQFTEHCPEYGCVAVQYSKTGNIAHAWPYRLEELEKAAVDFVEFPYEISTDFSFVRDTGAAGIDRYANGDLLVVFQYRGKRVFPYAGGVARINPEGYPVWFHRDYSHHKPHLLENGIALVPGYRISDQSVSFQIRGRNEDKPRTVKLCPRGKQKLMIDTVKKVDGDGRILQEIALLDVLLESDYAPVFLHTSSTCDPVHLNYIHQLREDAGGTWGMAPGDLVVSMRNLSAFAILDGSNGKVKRLHRGSFFQQHSVLHLADSSYVLFDNHGGDKVGGPSRALLVDLADGHETTIFPNDKTPTHLRGLFADTGSQIAVSPDRRRLIATFQNPGVAVEVRISDGEVLNAFTNLHDVSSLEPFGGDADDKAAHYRLSGISYAH